MTTFSIGKQTGALPAAPTIDFGGLVHKIIISPDPAAVGVTYFQQIKQEGVVLGSPLVIVPFAKGAITPPFVHCAGREENDIDPTEFSIGQATAGDGCFVTYAWL